MGLPDFRQRAGLLFLAVAVGHIVLISAQVNSKSGVPLLHAVVFGAFSQVQRGAAGLVGSGQTAWKDYVDLRKVRGENSDLRRRLAELQVKLQRQQSLIEENARLTALVDLRQRSGLSTTGAQVIGGSVTPDFRTITLDKGRGEGLRADMAVLSPVGVVGRIVTPSRGTSKVQLLVDRNAAIAALVERSRAQGIITGTGEDLLKMEYYSATADIKEGDTVVSSGLDGIYPKGLPIGRVQKIERVGTTIKAIMVRPSVDFGTLEEVLVVLANPTPPATTGNEAEKTPPGNGAQK